MVNSSKQKQYYYWVDNTKCIACILVVLGHFWMSMVVSGILKENVIYDFTIQSIYTFHVPLFAVVFYTKNPTEYIQSKAGTKMFYINF